MTSQHGNENNMGDDDDIVYQGDFFKLSESKKRLIGSKADTWKPKYLVIRLKGEKPILEYHKKKPKTGKKSERTLTDTFELWPTYKVEKLQNARGRVFVCEITSPDFHIFLSADEEKEIDVLVFLLQVQIRLKDNIRKDIIPVRPIDSECQQKIGAQGSHCVLHASPWGLILALEQTRALLAQWPLKSIRYYEASGTGNFNIEAGRVAPMGEGLFKFKTQQGDDDFMYDLVDSYIVNTLDRVKPKQKGTREEIEDYIREHDHLHSLTTISVCPPRTPEIQNILKRNWNIGSPTPGSALSTPSPSAQSRSPRSRGRRAQASTSSTATDTQSTVTSQSSSLVINLERPGDVTDSRRNSSDARSGHRSSTDEGRVTDRPPPLPSRSATSGVPRRSRRREHSIPRKVDVTGTPSDGETMSISSEGSLASPGPSPRRHSNPANIVHSVNADKVQPLSLNINLAQSAHQHTEFYKMSSPNMKVRVSKSPIITKNPNKVGRAEYLLSQQKSGVKSPGSTPDEEHQDTLDYFDAIAKASQQKYGGHNSIDRRWGKLQRELSSSDQSTSEVSSNNSPRVSVNLNHPSGYVNVPPSPQERAIHHSRQRSAPDTVLDLSAAQYSRQNSRDSTSNSMNSDSTLSPPPVQHVRQRSADEICNTSFGSIDPRPTSDSCPRSAGNRKSGDGSHHSRQNSVNSSRSHPRGSEEIQESDARERVSRQLSGFSGIDNIDQPIGEWLMSASCEDLSDHMRTVIYDDNNNGHPEGPNAYEEIDENKVDAGQLTVSSTDSAPASDKPPLPFTDLKEFHDNTDVSGYARDRSKSFGYMNIPGSGSGASKPQSTAPSAHLIRKMVNARAKQETLRKSLSNPNFLNLGSKEHLCNLKTGGPSGNGSATKLAPQHKQKSKSFGSLFPAIKKALSRESLGHSRSTTPERRGSRSTTPERRSSFIFRRRSSDADANFKRQNSFHSYGEMTIKGIRMTERSRSFRRVRGAKSVEVLSKTNDDSETNRMSSATTVSSPAATDFTTQISTDDSNKAPDVSNTTPADTSTANKPSRDNAIYSSMKASVVNPSYVTTAHIALTSSPNLPPLPTLDKPPPLPAPRKKSSDDGISAVPTQNKGSINGGPSANSPYQNAPFQTTSGAHHDTTDHPKPHMRPKRPRVSNLVAKLEESSKQEERPAHSKTQSRSQNRQSASKSKIGDAARHEKPPSAGHTRGNSQKDTSENRRISSTSQRSSVNGDRSSASHISESKHRRSGHSHVSHTSEARNSRTSTSSQEPCSPRKETSSGHTRHMRDSRNSRSSTSSQESNVRHSQSISDSHQVKVSTEHPESSVKSEEPKSTFSQTTVKPFQPIPFKRQQNGIRSVHAPSGPAKSSTH